MCIKHILSFDKETSNLLFSLKHFMKAHCSLFPGMGMRYIKNVASKQCDQMARSLALNLAILFSKKLSQLNYLCQSRFIILPNTN